MRVLVTGSEGFIGKNLRLHLSEQSGVEVVCFNRNHTVSDLQALLSNVQFVFHLAGVNRPQDPGEFTSGNIELTSALADGIRKVFDTTGVRIPVLYTSSSQATLDTPYGISKNTAEKVLSELSRQHAIAVHTFRLPNVFGKWSQPNYNSVVATFCHNIAHDLPIQIHNPDADMQLVYVDDVVCRFIELMNGAPAQIDVDGYEMVTPVYSCTVGDLAKYINGFKASRETLTTDRVGAGLVRALYCTYLSYLPPKRFAYQVSRHADARGVFVEMLKTPDCGQFSFFTAHPGITRGGHYHHTKTEKFLVIKGSARFRFRHMQTGEEYVFNTSSEKSEIVETVPGWTHDVTNTGQDELVVMLWANEIFDPARPDTFARPL